MAAPGKRQINLLRGWPEASLLPARLTKEAAATALSDPKVAVPGLSYQPDWGYEPLRTEIANWLSDFYGPQSSNQHALVVTPDRLCISGGASQNLACVMQAFTDPVYTRYVWMVVPTYFLACRMFEDAGFHGRLRGVPEDGEGIDIPFLRAALERAEKEARANGNVAPKLKPPHPWNKRYKHLIYCVPTFSNPSGRTMSLRRREAIVRLAREFDALLVTDDVYDHLSWPHTSNSNWSERPYPKLAIAPRLVDIDHVLDGGPERPGADGFGNTLSQGTFSKLAGPGCRTGWAEGTPKAAYGLSQVGSSRSGGAPSGLVATFLAELLRSGHLQTWIRTKLQPNLAARCQRLRDAIIDLLVPLGVRFWDEGLGAPTQEFEGGYFIAIQLPEGVPAASLAERCKDEEDVIIAPGTAFAVWGDENVPGVDLTRMVRLCFSWETENIGEGGERVLREGVERVAGVLKMMLREGKRGEATAGANPAGIASQNT